MSQNHDESRDLLIETHTIVRGMSKQMEVDRAETAKYREAINARVTALEYFKWQLSGVIILLGTVVEYFRKQ